MKIRSAQHLVLSLSLLSTASIFAVEELDWRPFDKDGDLKLSPAEQDVYVLHCYNPVFRKYDVDYDGELNPAERAVMVKNINQDAKKFVERRRQDTINFAEYRGMSAEAPMSPEVYKKSVVIEKAEEDSAPKHFRLRATVEDFAKRVDGDHPLNAIDPAELSYARNNLNSSDQWYASGAVGGIWEKEGSFESFSLGAQIQRLVSDAPDVNEVNALVFKALYGNSYIFQNNPVVSNLDLNFGATYGTDFDFDGGLVGGTMSLTPMWKHPAFTGVWALFGVRDGHGISASNSPALTLSNSIRFEGGGTVQQFNNQQINDDEYLRVGPSVSASLWPLGVDFPFKFTASYANYFEVLGSGRDYRNYSVGAEWQLDRMGHFLLTATYQNGMTPLLLTDVDTFTVGMAIRF